MSETCISIPLKYCTYEIWPESRSVRTVFPDGLSCGGMRDENDPINIREAREGQGYTGPDAVWCSLVDHELLHSLACEHLFDRSSYVLREQAGDTAFVAAREKYYEEVLVLDIQLFINSGRIVHPNQKLTIEFDAIRARRNELLIGAGLL